jgi:hypothetical protein
MSADPVVKFLGARAASGRALDLLGLREDEVSPERVIAALQARLGVVQMHAEARTPQADEVRLALHAAAATLLNAAGREAIREGPAVVGTERAGEAAAASGVTGEFRGASRLALEADALIAIGLAGGWNQRSLDALLMSAHARGLTAEDVAEALESLEAPGRRAGASEGSGVRRVTPTGPKAAVKGVERPKTFELSAEEVAAQTRRRLKVLGLVMVGIGVGIFVVGISAAIVLRAWLRPSTPAVPEVVAVRPVEPAREPEKAAAAPSPARERTSVESAEDIRRELLASGGMVASDAGGAAARFEGAVRAASGSWSGWSVGETAAVLDAVIEYLYQASGNSSIAKRAVEALSGPVVRLASGGAVSSGELLPAAWSAGVLCRVLRERDLPQMVLGPARLTLAAAVPSLGTDGEMSFAAGARGALAVLADRLASSPTVEGWTSWVAGVTAVEGSEGTGRAGAVCRGIEGLLLGGPDPSQNKAAFDSITVLSASLTWRAEESSRAWLLRWFDMPQVTVGDLNAVTLALATRTSAPGVDSTMVVATSAGFDDRTRVRAAYAKAWALTGTKDRGAVVNAWKERAAEMLAESGGADDASRLGRAVRLSRLSEAAGLLWAGEHAKAEQIITELGVPAGGGGAGRAAANRSGILGEQNDGAWAVRYLSSMANIPVRQEMLKQALAAPWLTAVECEIVMLEALRGTPVAVRSAARDVVKRHSALPQMVNAMLEQTPSLAASAENAELVQGMVMSALPAVRDPKWRMGVRRALIERLLELVAGRGDLAAMDDEASKLAASYDQRLASYGGGESSGATGSASLLDLASRLRQRLERDAERALPTGREASTLASLRRRHAGRVSVSNGVVQRFAAEQFSAVEMYGYVLSSESPTHAEEVARVLAEFAAARRAADSVLTQIEAAEAAMVRLWRVRLVEGGGA